MKSGFPSMTALLGMLAVAGYQNRDKIAEMLNGAGGAAGRLDDRSGSYGRDPSMGAGGGVQGGGMQGGPLGGMMGGAGGPGGSGLGGMLGGLAGMFGGAAASGGAGGLLSGGLKDLVDRFRGAGHGDTVDSWVNHGPNREIAPRDLEGALGEDTLNELVQQTGLSRAEIVERLSRELPTAVDRYTPQGRLPTEREFG